MKQRLNALDTPTRRAFVERCAATSFGLSIVPTAQLAAAESAEHNGAGYGKAKSVIWLMLSGGLSHIDSLDPKQGKSKGPAKTINTSADFQVTEFFPKFATVADRVCVIRSMEAKIGVHKPAKYFMRTAYEPRGTILHPNLGAWGSHYLGRSSQTLPSNVCINRRSDQGNGFFPSSYAPLAIGDPSRGINDVDSIGGKSRAEKRLALLNGLDADFRRKTNDKAVNAYNGFYDDALALMKSKELKAFDLSHESSEQRTAYGNNSFGQGCLLARRLVESGVRFVEVNHDGWDHHKALADEMEDVAPVFDQAFATLITDLERRGMLDSTLVVVATEFGRKPDFSGDGRSHHPVCFSTVLAGGGAKPGFVYGKSDDRGYYVDENAVSVGAFHASIAFASGMEIEKPALSPSGRPMTVGDGEKPVLELFS
ncbi:MAG: DUF1501 domain-containing protein [Planctomycetaceae bacterium]|nr:DUF1501 domain-containing protein [Planctomycetaceae bacterium]